MVAENFGFIKHAAKAISDMAAYEGQIIKLPDYELQSMYEKFKHQR